MSDPMSYELARRQIAEQLAAIERSAGDRAPDDEPAADERSARGTGDS